MNTEISADILDAVAAYRQRLAERRQRGLVVLSGARPWSRLLVQDCLFEAGQALWLGEAAPDAMESLPAASARHLLGQERGDVVFDAWSGFDADALGAISGSLRAGHILFLLAPAFEAWPDYDEPELARINVEPYGIDQVGRRFIARIIEQLSSDPAALCITQQAGVLRPPQWPHVETGKQELSPPCLSDDQQQAVDALLHVVHGHRRRPLVISSDRGRGKSSALGLAAAALLGEGRERIIVTAPALNAAEVIFDRLAEVLPDGLRGRGRLQWRGGEVLFMSPDELLRRHPEADMVMVDEAAAIPVGLLTGLLRRYSRIAFATTVHGYEGTGRGFELRFKQVLERETPQWQECRMKTPIRWNAGDPLETSIYQLLMLDAATSVLPAESTNESYWTIEHLSRDALSRDEAKLRQLFGLLINAHYRTRPYDLRYLLDAPNVELFCLQQEGNIIGVVVAVHEGLAGQAIKAEIYHGKRRLHGHLLPQSLLVHAGEQEALDYSYLRIMRIAIHPDRRRQGLGSAMLDFVGNWAREHQLDILAASFGATAELLQFWQQWGMQAVRVGYKRESSSGSHAVMLIQPLDLRAEAFFQRLRDRFIRELPYLLGEPLRQLDSELVPGLMRQQSMTLVGEYRLSVIQEFARDLRDYDTSLVDLWHFLIHAVSRWDQEEAPRLLQPLSLLIMKLWQRYDFIELSELTALPGRRGVVEALRIAVNDILNGLFPESSATP